MMFVRTAFLFLSDSKSSVTNTDPKALLDPFFRLVNSPFITLGFPAVTTAPTDAIRKTTALPAVPAGMRR